MLGEEYYLAGQQSVHDRWVVAASQTFVLATAAGHRRAEIGKVSGETESKKWVSKVLQISERLSFYPPF